MPHANANAVGRRLMHHMDVAEGLNLPFFNAHLSFCIDGMPLGAVTHGWRHEHDFTQREQGLVQGR